MEPKTLNIHLNKHLKKTCSIPYRPHLSLENIISESSECFGIKPKKSFKIYDIGGAELSDGDIELLNLQEPLFLSKGEPFSKKCCLSIYSEIKQIGQGGFGTVKLYINKSTQQEVALKFIDYNTIENTDDVRRMYNEIAALRSLKHSNIVKLIDAFDLDDKMCFVMEYCSGGELMEFIKEKGRLTEDEVHTFGAQIINAVRYCHNSKVIHRDLKPENVLFSNTERKQVKIVDFGIAGMFNIGKMSDSSEAGSLLYTAPEVISGIDFRSNPALDIWSLGCIIYMMLTGKHPFEDKTQEDTIEKIICGSYAPLASNIPSYWKKFFNKIFKVDPNERYNMVEVSAFFDKLKFGRDFSDESSEEIKQSVPNNPPKTLANADKNNKVSKP
jgi:serine/threonine protein kinase